MGTFLSYSRADSDFVDILYRLLNSKGYDAWLDRPDISVGSRWDKAIEDAIKQRSHLTVVLSPDSVESQNVADEWSFAIDEDKSIIPIMYRPCDVPMRLRRLNWIDFTNKTIAESFKEYINILGEPDYHPNDRYELAKRDGMVFIKLPEADIRIAFVYTDYPESNAFLRTVWFTLLWRIIPRNEAKESQNYDYGKRWSLRHTETQETYPAPKENTLIHEMGIEPNSSLEVVLH